MNKSKEQGRQSVPPEEQQESELWSAHEHIAPEGQLHAQRLLRTVGTPGLAKLAIDQVELQAGIRAIDDTDLAQRLGYVSFLDLFDVSIPVSTEDERQWYLTRQATGTWFAWERLSRWISSEFDLQEAGSDFVQSTVGREIPASTSSMPKT
jgi:hypothetical protein